ncbi:MAG: chloramphenicol acetyltransferase [Candidatus Competibacteraceae bacterium]|nr:chloramphenicol acetyltransferase [Candidatus Competibacteraceae bacterium]
MKKLGTNPVIHQPSKIEGVRFGTYTEIGEFSYLENVEFGDFSYAGQFCFFQNTVVKKFANIAAQVRVGPTMHPIDRPTLHHFTYRRILYDFAPRNDEAFFEWRRLQTAVIGNDTWIGHGATIMPGVIVGDGSVIGAGAVVTKNVDPYTVVVGVPAKPIKKRFPDEIAEKLRRIAWWEWDYETVKNRLADFTGSVEAFVEKYS